MRHRKHVFKDRIALACGSLILMIAASCTKHEITATPPQTSDTTHVPFNIDQIADTYAQFADVSFSSHWGPYNVHDPSVIKEGIYFYSFSTDVAYAVPVRPGLQVRRSKDLVEWQFWGWVFPFLPDKGSTFIRAQGGVPNNSLWAPYVLKVGNTFRLYYSLSSPTPRLSVIGLATASSPEGPWTEQGLVVTSLNDKSIQTNAIDPTVVIDKGGNHWLYYGSAWDGIYILKLDPATGLALNVNDKGRRISQRGFTGNQVNGNIEGAEIIYNAEFDKYYLFISYDWLETKYNVRVARADQPDGPFYDFNNIDINNAVDHTPMIVAPYRLGAHPGWQGTGHCSVFSNAGRYYMMHQGRPAVNPFFMDMHVRQMFWTKDGWPIVSPERYAKIENEPVVKADVTGSWDRVVLNYSIVPGYDKEQTSGNIQVSTIVTLDAPGTINGSASSSWTFNYPDVTLSWADGSVEKLIVHRGRDWENRVNSTILFTGLNQEGTAVWGKKIN